MRLWEVKWIARVHKGNHRQHRDSHRQRTDAKPWALVPQTKQPGNAAQRVKNWFPLSHGAMEGSAVLGDGVRGGNKREWTVWLSTQKEPHMLRPPDLPSNLPLLLSMIFILPVSLPTPLSLCWLHIHLFHPPKSLSPSSWCPKETPTYW